MIDLDKGTVSRQAFRGCEDGERVREVVKA